MQTAYPLSWPSSWPRTRENRRETARFFSSTRRTSSVGGSDYFVRGKVSMANVTDEIINEVRAIGGQQLVISTNVELKNNGLPYANRQTPRDQGAAIYFALKGKPCVLACDKWNRVEDNLRAIAKHIEALRGQERWGVGSVEQAFAGYTALPAPGDSAAATWYQVLGVAHDAPYDVARDAYVRESKLCHPDNGGSHDAQVRLNAAWDMARKAYNR